MTLSYLEHFLLAYLWRLVYIDDRFLHVRLIYSITITLNIIQGNKYHFQEVYDPVFSVFQRPMKQSVSSVGKLKILLNRYSAQAVAVTTMAAAWSHLLI